MKSILLSLAYRHLHSLATVCFLVLLSLFFYICTCLKCHPHSLYLMVFNLSFKTLLKDALCEVTVDVSKPLLTRWSDLWWLLHLDAYQPSAHCILIIFTCLFH